MNSSRGKKKKEQDNGRIVQEETNGTIVLELRINKEKYEFTGFKIGLK